MKKEIPVWNFYTVNSENEETRCAIAYNVDEKPILVYNEREPSQDEIVKGIAKLYVQAREDIETQKKQLEQCKSNLDLAERNKLLLEDALEATQKGGLETVINEKKWSRLP